MNALVFGAMARDRARAPSLLSLRHLAVSNAVILFTGTPTCRFPSPLPAEGFSVALKASFAVFKSLPLLGIAHNSAARSPACAGDTHLGHLPGASSGIHLIVASRSFD
ncbi:MAG: hypothetical protein ACREQP_03700 [Candidatus Binatia bacterium]